MRRDGSATGSLVGVTTKIVIDTNKLLDFYRAGKHPKAVFDELKKVSTCLVWPNQIIDEFNRNRLSALREMKKGIRDQLKFSLPRTPLLDSIEEAGKMRDALSKLKTLGKALEKRLDQAIESTEHDPIAREFQELIDGGERITITSGMLDMAHYRRLRGAPPSSRDRHSAGDEIIFESLLTLKYDVVLVTGDKGFLEHIDILMRDFERETNHKLQITDDLSAAMKKLGMDADAIEVAESELEAERLEAQAQEYLARCYDSSKVPERRFERPHFDSENVKRAMAEMLKNLD